MDKDAQRSHSHTICAFICATFFSYPHISARAIEQLTGIIGTDEIESGETTTGDSSLTKVAASVMDLSDTFFPHEYFEAVPILRFEHGHDERRQLVAGFEVFNGVPPGAGETFEMTLEMYAGRGYSGLEIALIGGRGVIVWADKKLSAWVGSPV